MSKKESINKLIEEAREAATRFGMDRINWSLDWHAGLLKGIELMEKDLKNKLKEPEKEVKEHGTN